MSRPDPNTPFNWQSLIPYGVNFGLGVLGNKIQNAPANAQNQWTRQQYEQQLARRNALQGLALPSMIRALGYRDPEQIQQMIGQVNQASGPSMMGGTVPQGTTGGGSTAGSVAKTALGLAPTGLQIAKGAGLFGGAGAGAAGALSGGGSIAGAGSAVGTLGIGATAPSAVGGIGAGAVGAHGVAGALGLHGGAGLLGMGGATIPVLGAGVAAALLAKHFVHEGAHAANKFVQGSENVLGQTMARVSAGQGTPEEFKQAYNTYQQSVQSALQHGGNEAKVAQQSLNNQALQQTIQRLAQQLGIPLGAA